MAVWDVDSGEELLRLDVINNGINSTQFSPDGSRLLLSNVDGSVGLWNIEKGTLIMEMEEHTYPAWCAVFSPDGTTIASGSADKTIVLWDAATGSEQTRLTGHEKDVYCVAFSPDGRWLYSGSVDKHIRAWSLDGTDPRWETLSVAWQGAEEEDARAAAEAAVMAATQTPAKPGTTGLFGRLFGGKR
jgi:WD40 repeat protein